MSQVQNNCYNEFQKEEKRYKKKRHKILLGLFCVILISALWFYLLLNLSQFNLSEYALYIFIGGLAFMSISFSLLRKAQYNNTAQYNRTMETLERLALEDKIKNN